MNKAQVHSLPVSVPPSEVVTQFESFARPLVDWVGALQDENLTLTAIRDALLPKLVSGQIRVPDTSDPEEVIGPVAEEAAA